MQAILIFKLKEDVWLGGKIMYSDSVSWELYKTFLQTL